MKVLVVSFNDSDNLTIENVLYELESHGHEVTIYAPYRDNNSIRMFQGLKANIEPISSLTPDVAKQFDVAFCSNMTMQYVKLIDIYCFAYSSFYNETFMTDGADFLFTYRSGCMPRCNFHCASMQVGDPKNDKLIYRPVENSKRILYIDSGHVPFGRKGKEQIASMLLDICKKFPEYELCIKPRWLRDKDVHFTHRNTEHIYTIIEEMCNGVLPDNLNMLEEHLNLQELIDSSISVVTLYTGAILNVVLQNKGLVIASGWDCEDKWDVRKEIEIKKQGALFAESGCAVNYKDVTKYLPEGLHAKKEFRQKMFCYETGASARIVDVMEHVYTRFLKKGVYPMAKEYKYETYLQNIVADPSITIHSLKQERVRDMLQQTIARFSYMITAPIDFLRYYEELDRTYKDYSPEAADLENCYKFFSRLQTQIVLEQSSLMQNNPVDQSFFLKALYDSGKYNDILSIPSEKILCTGPYHYYLGMIYKKKNWLSMASNEFNLFLQEANKRSYSKYIQEENSFIRDAFSCIFDAYDGKNVASTDIADLYINLCEQREITLVDYQSRKRVHNMLPQIAEQLAEIDQAKAIKCLQLYAKYEYHYNIRERNNQLNDLKRYIADFHRSKTYRWSQAVKWPIKKVKGGVKCIQEHGWRYTFCRVIEQFQEFTKKKIQNKSFYKIWSVFHNKVMAGFHLYSQVIQEYGDNANLICASPATGDTYIFGSLFQAYVSKKYPDCKNVYGVYGESGATIAKLFSIEHSKAYSLADFQSLYNLLMFDSQGLIHMECLHYHVFYRHTAILAYLEGLHQFNYFSLAQSCLGVTDSEITKPRFVYDEAFLHNFFEENHLVEKKTVLLLPYAKSVRSIPFKFWSNLARRLIALGFCVATNTVGPEEIPVEGTVPISISHDKTVPFLEYAGVSIGVRNGFHDITNSANCLKITLYQRNAWKRSLVCCDYDSFWVSAMYQNNDQHDLFYSLGEEDELIEQIVQLVLSYGNRKLV